jgi:predicted metalloprotease with PDZ domain
MNAVMLLALTAAQQTALPREVSITKAHEDWSTVTITLDFQTEAGDAIGLNFTRSWGPAENLTELVSNVRVNGPDGVLPHTLDGAALTVPALPEGPVSVSYDIAQDYEGEPQWGVQRMPGMRPVLQADYAYFAGGAVLPDFDAPVGEVSVSLPDGGAFNRPVDAEGRSAPVSYAALSNGLFAFGAFRMGEAEDAEIATRSAVRGEWPLSDAMIQDVTRLTLERASARFDDTVFDEYFVMITPLPALPQGSAVIGSGFDEAFFLLATPNADASNIIHTITHEVLHEWIPRRAGQTDEATDPSRAWFTEGFTEYFTQTLLLETGRISLEDYAANLDALWTAYRISDVNTLPAEALNNRLFESEQTERLPYQRGTLLALHWDTILKREGSEGLSNVLANLIDSADVLSANGLPRILTDQTLHAALQDALGEQFDADYQRHIVAGNLIDLRALALPDCLEADADAHLRIKPGYVDLSGCEALITRP